MPMIGVDEFLEVGMEKRELPDAFLVAVDEGVARLLCKAAALTLPEKK